MNADISIEGSYAVSVKDLATMKNTSPQLSEWKPSLPALLSPPYIHEGKCPLRYTAQGRCARSNALYECEDEKTGPGKRIL